MSRSRQAALVALIAVLALAGWALFLPAARPVLSAMGLMPALGALGLVQGDGAAGAAPGPGAGAGAGGAGAGRPGGAAAAVMVAAQPPGQAVLADTITAIGTARSVRLAQLASEVSGRLVRVAVASGSAVRAGDLIAALDSESASIARDRAALVLADAESDLVRVRSLQGSGSGTPLQVQEAELALRTAELALREAEFDLSRRQLVAPIAGRVGILDIEPGDLLSPGDLVTTIEDRSAILVDFRVPERAAARVALGDSLRVAPLTDPDAQRAGQIAALDNRLDSATRTLRLQAAIANDDDRLRAGMALAVSLDYRGDSLPSVDPLAIQWSGEGAHVWVVRAGKAQRLPVEIVQRNPDAVLVRAAFQPEDLVVREGMQMLRPGSAVQLAGPGGPDAS